VHAERSKAAAHTAPFASSSCSSAVCPLAAAKNSAVRPCSSAQSEATPEASSEDASPSSP